jgi:hypothetical protein
VRRLPVEFTSTVPPDWPQPRTAPSVRGADGAPECVSAPWPLTLLDEALAAVRQFTGLDQVLGLVSLLPSLAGAARHDVAREAHAVLTRPEAEREPIHKLIDAWPWLAPEPRVAFYVSSPALRSLRARVLPTSRHLARRAEVLAPLTTVLRIDDAHRRGGGLAALGAHLPDAAERERVGALAESVACTSARSWIGLAHVLTPASN